jgi:transglutaminase-like putative cysteine protease
VITSATEARRGLPLALLVAGTTWFTMLSWRGFADVWGTYLGPLLLVALVCAVSGVLLRAVSPGGRLGMGLQVLVVGVVVWLLLGGSFLHPVSSSHQIAKTINDAWYSASTFAPPIPTTVPSIAPLMVPCGALALLLSDFLACWGRRASLAGLPMVGVYCVAVGLLGDGVSWVVFLGSAAGFLLMLFVQESAKVARWGRPLGSAATAENRDFGAGAVASRANAVTVGAIAMVLAVILPVFIPTLHLPSPNLFGPGGGGSVKVINPVADLRRNLVRGHDVPLLDVRTTDPDPSYLRIAVLTDFNGVQWQTGDRAIVSDQVADGLLPVTEQHLGAGVLTDAYPYTVTTTRYFDSTWLPTEFPVSSISASGSWHYDLSTMDFFSTSSDTNAEGITYQMTAAKPHLSGVAMAGSLTAPLQIQSTYTHLPSQVSPLAQRLAQKVTQGARSRFQAMTMLQDWFRSHFRYDVNTVETLPGDGNSALDEFLSRGHRVGYCQQFASAFAVMARTLHIPARVAVGFLQPKRMGHDHWQYSAWDMHAWPEVFFQGSGWVRFEPTPADRAASVPVYADVGRQQGGKSLGGPSTAGQISHATTAPSTPSPTPRTSSGTAGAERPWRTALLVLLAVILGVGVLLLVPRTVRRGRRTRRLAGGVEDAWAELRDSAVDLGVGWPRGRSPRETGERLAGWFGSEPDGAREVRPRRGRGLAPEAEAALDRIVLMVEQVRYARHADDLPGRLSDDVQACIVALERGCTSRTLSRARWFPRSVLSWRRGTHESSEPSESEVVGLCGVHDRVS